MFKKKQYIFFGTENITFIVSLLTRRSLISNLFVTNLLADKLDDAGTFFLRLTSAAVVLVSELYGILQDMCRSRDWLDVIGVSFGVLGGSPRMLDIENGLSNIQLKKVKLPSSNGRCTKIYIYEMKLMSRRIIDSKFKNARNNNMYYRKTTINTSNATVLIISMVCITSLTIKLQQG